MQAPSIDGDRRTQLHQPALPCGLVNWERTRRTENGRDNSRPHRDTHFLKVRLRADILFLMRANRREGKSRKKRNRRLELTDCTVALRFRQHNGPDGVPAAAALAHSHQPAPPDLPPPWQVRDRDRAFFYGRMTATLRSGRLLLGARQSQRHGHRPARRRLPIQRTLSHWLAAPLRFA